MSEYALLPISFFTSCLAGSLGMGGGVLLLALMPGLVPAASILPLHAVVQLASNFSRAGFGWRSIEWRLIPPVTLGAVVGAWLGSEVYSRLDLSWLPVLIGGLILLLTWLPLPRPRGRGYWSLLILGCYQTGLGMVAGATGPLGAAVLSRYSRQRDWLVVNTSVYMGVSHLCKALAFGLLGFSLWPWWPLLLGMIVASVLGSWVGTRVRAMLPEADFLFVFRLLVTALAVRMIVLGWP